MTRAAEPRVRLALVDRENRATALAAFVALFGLIALVALLAERTLLPTLVTLEALRGQRLALAAMLGSGLARVVAPVTLQRPLLLGFAVLGFAGVLGAPSACIFAFVALVLLLGRTKFALRVRLAIAIAAWSSIPILRAAIVVRDAPTVQWSSFTLVWASLLYSTFYVLVERQRLGGSVRWDSEALYFFALPRLAVPILQPIPARYMLESERRFPSLALTTRGAALGLYAVALGVAGTAIDRWLLRTELPPLLEQAIEYVRFYGLAAERLMLAIAFFRLLGFDLESGFRLPYLSTSFSEFFRRHDAYVRRAIVSLLYYPLFDELRSTMRRPVAALLATAIALVLGGLVVNNLVLPAVAADDMLAGVTFAAAPGRLALLVCFFSLVLLSGTSLSGTPEQKSPLPRVLRVVLFNLMLFAIWYLFGDQFRRSISFGTAS